MSGATLRTGDAAQGGPYLGHFVPDGTLTLLKGDPPVQYGGGTWKADHDRLCDTIRRRKSERTYCFRVVADGKLISLFDEDGLLQRLFQYSSTLTGYSR